MSEQERSRYPVLIADDKIQDLQSYKNGIKKACGGEISLEVLECTSAREVRAALAGKLCAFFSIDKKMPEYPGGEQNEEIGVELAELAATLNPISRTTILTAFPEWRTAGRAERSNIFYVSKDDYTASSYGEYFFKAIMLFEKETCWTLGADILPEMLSFFCRSVVTIGDKAQFERQGHAFSLWETGIRLLALADIATLDFLGDPLKEYLNRLSNRLDNQNTLGLINKVIHRVGELLTSSNLTPYAVEHSRFFSEEFLKCLRMIQQTRNRAAHSPPKRKRDAFTENRSWFVTFLLSMAFWGLHPIVSNLAVVPWGARTNALQGTVIGRANAIPTEKTWHWDRDQDFVINPNHLYQVFTNPNQPEKALIVPLFPLIRMQPNEDTVWLAHRPLHNEYRDPLTGDTRVFDDNELFTWWSTRMNKSTAVSNISIGPERTTSSQFVSEMGKGAKKPVAIPPQSLREIVRGRLEAYYTSQGRASVEERDANYQAGFDGIRKAGDVIKYISTLENFPSDKLAYVSIGGADGSEITYVLQNSAMCNGILVESSDYGAAEARKSRDTLKRTSKELVVFQGDAMQRLDDCSEKLWQWKKNDQVEGVILSIQSVLHELPYRSPRFDPNVLIARIFEHFPIRVFYCREPTKPVDWPPVVHFRIGGLEGRDLSATAKQINDVLGFREQVENLADDFVQTSADLAIETLFKVLYCKDLERYKYEMNERLTAFDPEEFARIVRNYIRPYENVELQHLVSDTFRTKYREYKIEARTTTGERLGIPKVFVQVTGFQNERSEG